MTTIETNAMELELTGGELQARFTAGYPFFWVRNDSSDTVRISLSPNISDGKDGVITIPAGSSNGTMHGYRLNDLYISGSGKVMVMGTGSAHNPFKLRGKGGDAPTPPAFLPYSAGLIYWFDFEKGYDPVQKIWRDQIRGLELPLADTHPGDALTTASSEFSVPESSGQWAYTYYVVSKCRFPSDWKTIIGSYGTNPQFNLACRYGKYWIGTGQASGQMSTSVSVSDNFTVNCLNFSGGFGEWYCHRYSMTQPVGNYTSYHSPNNDRIQIGSKIDFKAIAIFKNISQGRDIILENMAFLKDKFQIE